MKIAHSDPAGDPFERNIWIKGALAAQLEGYGYKTNNDNPDFLVAYYSGSKENLEPESFGYGYPRNWRWGFGPVIWKRYYTEGSMVMDVIDAKNNQLVWRGLVTDTIGNTPAESEKQVNNGMKDLVKHFVKDTKNYRNR